MQADDLNQGPNVLVVNGVLDSRSAVTELRLADGRVVRLPTAVFSDYSLAEAGDAVYAEQPRFVTEPVLASGDERVVIPIVEERLEVGKRTVATGTVRLHKTVHEFEAQLNEPLAVTTFDVERVILHQVVDVAPGVRLEGDTTVYPLVEEQLILTKQLVLKEEIRVTRRDTERVDTQKVVLRREHVIVEREPAS